MRYYINLFFVILLLPASTSNLWATSLPEQEGVLLKKLRGLQITKEMFEDLNPEKEVRKIRNIEKALRKVPYSIIHNFFRETNPKKRFSKFKQLY